MEQLQSSLVPIIAKTKPHGTFSAQRLTQVTEKYSWLYAVDQNHDQYSYWQVAEPLSLCSLNCSLCRLFKEACYCHIDVLKRSLDRVQGSESVYLYLSLPMVHYRKKKKPKTAQKQLFDLLYRDLPLMSQVLHKHRNAK